MILNRCFNVQEKGNLLCLLLVFHVRPRPCPGTISSDPVCPLASTHLWLLHSLTSHLHSVLHCHKTQRKGQGRERQTSTVPGTWAPGLLDRQAMEHRFTRVGNKGAKETKADYSLSVHKRAPTMKTTLPMLFFHNHIRYSVIYVS